MLDSFWIMLAAKMTTTAIIVVAASKVVERVGPFIGAMVATLPISAGPSYIFLAAEHGADFVHRAALVSLATNAATFGFGALYALLARSRPLPIALGVSFGLWLVAAVVIVETRWTFATAGLLNILVFIPAYLATRACRAAAPDSRPRRAGGTFLFGPRSSWRWSGLPWWRAGFSERRRRAWRLSCRS